MDLNNKVNDYDKFAEKRHYEVTNGMKKSLRFVEKPMMISMLPNLEGKRYLKRSNNIPMAVLKYLTPKEKRAELEVFGMINCAT